MPAAEGTRATRRNRTLGIGLAVVIASSAIGWAAGRQIRSPAEIAARTASPVPSPISVPVDTRVLSSDVVTRGTVRFGAPQVVSLATSALKKTTGTVTAAPVKGATVDEGSVALSVSGRPVFALVGTQPAYRDLGPGAVGDDVRQLEEALRRMRFNPGTVDGTYDIRTASAVAAWYQAKGWTALGPTEEQVQLRRTARTDLSQAQSDLFAAREAVAGARAGLASAEERLAAATAAAQAAPGTDAAARTRADADRLAASAEVAARTNGLEAALGDELVARARLDEGRSADPPLSPAELAALEATAGQAAGAVRTARAALAAARAAEAAVGPSPAGSATAEAARAVAAGRGEVARAAEAVRMSEGREDVVAGRVDPASLGDIERKLGIQLPADEVLFFPTLPLRIDEARVKPGEALAGPVMTVTNSRLAVDAALSAADAKLVKKGGAVAISEPDLGIAATGTVSEVADTPGTRGVDPQRFHLEVVPGDTPVLPLGATVVLTITVESTGGEVLAVPVAALSLAGDGTSRVQVLAPDRAVRFVTVTPGFTAKGLVAVTPVGAGLVPGDLVVVGNGARATPGRSAGPGTTTSAVPTTTGGTNGP